MYIRYSFLYFVSGQKYVVKMKFCRNVFYSFVMRVDRCGGVCGGMVFPVIIKDYILPFKENNLLINLILKTKLQFNCN